MCLPVTVHHLGAARHGHFGAADRGDLAALHDDGAVGDGPLGHGVDGGARSTTGAILRRGGDDHLRMRQRRRGGGGDEAGHHERGGERGGTGVRA
jgi:hypothetical protein